eukprot:gene16942-18648_t
MADQEENFHHDPSSRFKQLSAQADNVIMDKNIPPRRYFRSGLEIERMAAVYLEEGNLEKSFILYMKYIILFVEKLPKHPQYKQADPVQKVKQILAITEKLKATIKKTYEDDYAKWLETEKQKKLDEERQRREVENCRKREQEEVNLQKLRAAEESDKTFFGASAPIPPPSAPLLEEDYPSAPQISDFDIDKSDIPIEDLPPPPSYSSIHIEASDVPSFSPLPQEDVTSGYIPYVDRAIKPKLSTFLDRQDSTPINGMRRIYIPDELISKFLSIASSNTRMNLETCGILTGRLARNLFHITHLVIPKQTATSDSCTTSNEEEMFDVQDKHDLVTLGWIHTHPSQTSFLSSVDLHTQYAYQMLMPEAIAIVCSPKFNQVGVYRLTTHYGMSFIGSCSKPGFHPHPKEPPLFEDTEHAQRDVNMKVEVIDLR